jgi:hypothetical protein
LEPLLGGYLLRGYGAVDMRWLRALNVLPLLLVVASTTPAKSPAVYTPAPGSAERTAIVKTLHDGDEKPEFRFTFRQFRVFRAGSRAIAYVRGEGQVGAFQAILKREGKARWRKVWGESDGGSDSCEAGAVHYDWALRLIRTYKVDPDSLFPGVVERTRELKLAGKTEPELQCVGDLDGGPK